MGELHNDSEPKSTSKESSYLDKNKETHDNSSADEDENCLKTPKAAKKKGRTKTYETLEKFSSPRSVDLKIGTVSCYFLNSKYIVTEK
jgi:hypothetical protein